LDSYGTANERCACVDPEHLQVRAVDASRSLISHVRKEIHDPQDEDEFDSSTRRGQGLWLHRSHVIEKSHETEIHVQLLVAVE